MAEFLCIRKCWWGLQLWEKGQKLIDVPEDQVKDVPDHFERIDSPPKVAAPIEVKPKGK